MTLQNLPNYDPESCIYDSTVIDSNFYDVDSFTSKFTNSKQPIFLSVNIQSINAKHEILKELMCTLQNKKIPIEILALQETWAVRYVNLLDIPGFERLIFKNRSVGRGGGSWILCKKWTNCKANRAPLPNFCEPGF
jgi:hypothetical protein